MSLETWKKEFYPKEPSKWMSKVQAIQHSLTKWIGLRPENLEKHGLRYDEVKILVDNDHYMFWVNDKSCALCVKYYKDESETPCKRCPLYKTLGNIPCDGFTSGLPYRIFVDTHSPEPMISALEKTLLENKK